MDKLKVKLSHEDWEEVVAVLMKAAAEFDVTEWMDLAARIERQIPSE